MHESRYFHVTPHIYLNPLSLIKSIAHLHLHFASLTLTSIFIIVSETMADAYPNLPRTYQQEVVYKECRHNLAASVGRTCFDGCLEFAKAGEEGTEEAMRCAACGCHRNFHRRETVYNPATKVQNFLNASSSTPPIRGPVSRVQRLNLGSNNPEQEEFETSGRLRRRRRRLREMSNEQGEQSSSCLTKE